MFERLYFLLLLTGLWRRSRFDWIRVRGIQNDMEQNPTQHWSKSYKKTCILLRQSDLEQYDTYGMYPYIHLKFIVLIIQRGQTRSQRFWIRI
jgi:hypothetical protein